MIFFILIKKITKAYLFLQTGTYKKKEYVGLYSTYERRFEDNKQAEGLIKVPPQPFNSILTELSKNVFFIPLQENFYSHFKEMRISETSSRKTWLNVVFTIGTLYSFCTCFTFCY